MSDSVRPHRWQPTRLPRSWDSQGKNSGEGCHFLLQCVKVKSLGRVRVLATPWTAAHQAPPSTGFSRQEYWSGVPLPSPSLTSKTPHSLLVFCFSGCSFFSLFACLSSFSFLPSYLGWFSKLDPWTFIHHSSPSPATPCQFFKI